MLVIKEKDLVILEGECRELDAPGDDVHGFDGQDGGGELQLPELLALGGEANQGVVHRGHGDGLLATE